MKYYMVEEENTVQNKEHNKVTDGGGNTVQNKCIVHNEVSDSGGNYTIKVEQ